MPSYLMQTLTLTVRWGNHKRIHSINCSISMEEISGGRIMSVLHMHRLLTNNVDGFTWHNYARNWQNDHHIPLERIKRSSSLETKLLVKNETKLLAISKILKKAARKHRKAPMSNHKNTINSVVPSCSCC